jgi:hypothetical protein
MKIHLTRSLQVKPNATRRLPRSGIEARFQFD